MQEGRYILNHNQINLIINRLCYQIVENYSNLDNLCIIGIQPRGVFFAEKIYQKLASILENDSIKYGKLDITFFRDDFRRNEKPIEASETQIDFLVENKKVIFVDDVIFTGRSVASALNAIQSFGRPKTIELLTLIDRKFCRHLPIQPDYTGRTIDATINEKVKVYWEENAGEDQVFLITN